MSLLKYIERVKRMDDLIRRNATGTASEFARKLNVSESQLYQDLKELKELGAPIDYCPVRKCYFYKDDCRLNLDFKKNIYGGVNYISPTVDDYYSEDSSDATLMNI